MTEKNNKKQSEEKENKNLSKGNSTTDNTQREPRGQKREREGSKDSGRENRRQGRRQRSSAFGKSKRSRKGRGGAEQPKSEFESKVLSARRVSRVVAGGRRFNLSVAVAVGNKKGKVGIGTGKGFDMAAAMEKARNQARKKLIDIKITEEKGIPSEAEGKYCSSVVHIRPNQGFVAGGAVRIIAELAGIEHINAKIQSRSKCHLNNARATLKAFEKMKG